MATIKDIAAKLGISISTVSKGLNGASDVSSEMRQLILDTAVEMGYTTKRMKKDAYKKLCVFVANINYESPSDFGYEVVLGFKQAASRDNWNINIMQLTKEFQAQEKYDTYMLKNGYSGSFILCLSPDDPWFEQVSGTKISTALFDSYIKKNSHVAYVGTDSSEGIEDAIDHLTHLGHTKIAFINGNRPSMVTEQRGEAYYDSMRAHQLPINEKLIAYASYHQDELSKCSGQIVENLLKEGATAIACATDMIAHQTIRECKKLGYRVPEDVSIVGFDDIPISAYTVPPLTTIRQDRIELGKSGYMALLSLMNHVSISKNLLRPQLIIRNSTEKVVDK
ncbi:MAG: LacI family DNA-binding transcriptional regulator [Lachnospiraceae bacterium]|nr:LacI family DNA-binding transcriptional regulator [Lachnospiraceae bacterium]